MPRVNYFQCKPKNMKGFIFSKRNISPTPLLRCGTERNLILNECDNLFSGRNELNKNNTMKVDIEKIKKELQDDDCAIAEEFNEDEKRIFTDLAKREVEKLYKFPKLSNTPKAKSGEIVSADRKRSSSYMSSARPWARPFRRKSTARLHTSRNPILDTIKEEQGTIMRNRQRMSSVEKRSTKAISQKENIAITRRIHETKVVNEKLNSVKISSCLKNGIRAMINKGTHKFSNTAQAQPKILTRREELLGESSEIPGDELVTIRRNKKIIIP